MAKMKDMIIDILEALTKSNMDYEFVASRFGMTPSEVYQIAREYGDID